MIECNNCHLKNNLGNSCRLCSTNYCQECLEPPKHQCHMLVRLGKTWIDPRQNRLDYTCSDCGDTLIKTKYSQQLEDEFNTLADLKSKIKSELDALITAEHHKKMGDLYLCFSQGDGEEYYWQKVRTKYSRDLLDLEYEIWKKIIEIHCQKECGLNPKHSLNPTKNTTKNRCGFPNCRQPGIRLQCSRCRLDFCTRHLLPEVHLCHGIKITITPGQAILCK